MSSKYCSKILVAKFSARSNFSKGRSRSIQIFGKLGVSRNDSWEPEHKTTLNIYCENNPEKKDNKIFKLLSNDTELYEAYVPVDREMFCEILRILNSCDGYSYFIISLYTSEDLIYKRLGHDEYLEILDADYHLRNTSITQ